MFIEDVLLSSKLFFNIKNINNGKVTRLKVTVEVLKTLDKLLRMSWSVILGFKFSYLSLVILALIAPLPLLRAAKATEAIVVVSKSVTRRWSINFNYVQLDHRYS